MAWACAPSHRMVHDGNRYFEHCYGADFDANITPAQREACWTAWLAHYTRHQAAHRIDYAMRRVEAIQAGEQTLRLPGLSGGKTDAPTDPRVGQYVDMHDPRAALEVSTTLTSQDAGAGGVPRGCTEACRTIASECTAHCPADAPGCKPLCARDQAICEEGCY